MGWAGVNVKALAGPTLDKRVNLGKTKDFSRLGNRCSASSLVISFPHLAPFKLPPPSQQVPQASKAPALQMVACAGPQPATHLAGPTQTRANLSWVKSETAIHPAVVLSAWHQTNQLFTLVPHGKESYFD